MCLNWYNKIYFLGLVFNLFFYCVLRYFDVILNCSLEYGIMYLIYILVVDNDDDLMKCGFFEYIEVGVFI